MPQVNINHAENIIKSALEVIEYLTKRNQTNKIKWQIRIGVHSGEVIGGIVGIKKYIYDVFGDAVNTASRMEQNSDPMKINISGSTHDILIMNNTDFSKNIIFEERRSIIVKGKGLMNMYFVNKLA